MKKRIREFKISADDLNPDVFVVSVQVRRSNAGLEESSSNWYYDVTPASRQRVYRAIEKIVADNS